MECPHSILYVEDDKTTSDVLRTMILRQFPEITIHVADNGDRGICLFKEHMPKIVITNIDMPVMDGLEMASRIKSIKDDSKFIVLTGRTDGECVKKFEE